MAADGMLASVSTVSDLTVCSRAAWTRGFYNDLRILDSVGNWYRVRSAKRDTAGSRWLWQVLTAAPVRVDLELDNDGPADLGAVKSEVLVAMNRFPEPWDSAVGKDLSDWREEVARQDTILDVIRLFLPA